VRLPFFFQRLSIAVQRFNAVLIQETFDLSDGQPDLWPIPAFLSVFNFCF